jgi:hypothetical protein
MFVKGRSRLAMQAKVGQRSVKVDHGLARGIRFMVYGLWAAKCFMVYGQPLAAKYFMVYGQPLAAKCCP